MIDYVSIYGRILMESDSPLSWDEEGVMSALAIAQRSGCTRARNGASFVRDRRSVVQGYNGPPSGFPRCDHDNANSCDSAVHAETNAVYWAARKGVPLEGTICYATTSPCRNCARAIIQCGATSVVYLKRYRDSSGLRELDLGGVAHRQLEIWRPTAFAGFDVSNLGNVRSWWGKGPQGMLTTPKLKKLRPKTTGMPYLVTTIDGIPRYIHRMVAESFLGLDPTRPEVCHRDGDCQNNSVDNLRWGTHTENEQDKLVHGTRLVGESHSRAKLTEKEVLGMRKMHSGGASLDYLSAYFAIRKSTVSRIVNRKLWKHI